MISHSPSNSYLICLSLVFGSSSFFSIYVENATNISWWGVLLVSFSQSSAPSLTFTDITFLDYLILLICFKIVNNETSYFRCLCIAFFGFSGCSTDIYFWKIWKKIKFYNMWYNSKKWFLSRALWISALLKLNVDSCLFIVIHTKLRQIR